MNYDIIIPTLDKRTETYNSVENISRFCKIIVVKDRWKCASKTRNIGYSLSILYSVCNKPVNISNKILCFIDDDITINSKLLLKYFSKVGKNKVLFCDPPCILLITENDFRRLGFFNENIKLTMGEITEYKYRMIKNNIQIEYIDTSKFIHHGGTSKRRSLHMFNLLYVNMLYPKESNSFKFKVLLNMILCKNPVNTIKQFLGFYYWSFIILKDKLK